MVHVFILQHSMAQAGSSQVWSLQVRQLLAANGLPYIHAFTSLPEREKLQRALGRQDWQYLYQYLFPCSLFWPLPLLWLHVARLCINHQLVLMLVQTIRRFLCRCLFFHCVGSIVYWRLSRQQ